MADTWNFRRRVNDEEADRFSRHGQIFFKEGKTVVSGSDINLVFPGWKGEEEHVLFVAPHDDDNHLGAGLLSQAVSSFGGQAYFLVVTDGRNGFCTQEEKSLIYEIRKNENIAASRILGIDRIIRLDYEDGNLAVYNTITTPDGKPGFHMELTRAMREFGVTRVIVPTFNYDHPDHKYTNEAVRICVFHAGTDIWGGRPTDIRTLLESAVYRPFILPPDIGIVSPQEAFTNKLKSIHAFASQKQIKSLADRVRKSGPYENFLSIPAPDYSPGKLFDRYF
ncbi:PIG-L family deacetylase [Candidatus Woesearchaeota archaeon]|nr:PIG-L family deacetylase [Candidatus Woesearchaeota archaeon]